MIESQELIDRCLEQAGEELIFDEEFSLRGIPGDVVYNVQSYDSPYDLDKQDFDFRVSRVKFQNPEYELTVGSTFTYTMFATTYKFKITKIIDDLTGWLQLDTSYLEKVVLDV